MAKVVKPFKNAPCPKIRRGFRRIKVKINHIWARPIFQDFVSKIANTELPFQTSSTFQSTFDRPGMRGGPQKAISERVNQRRLPVVYRKLVRMVQSKS
jgi:hypothetical protein